MPKWKQVQILFLTQTHVVYDSLCMRKFVNKYVITQVNQSIEERT